MFYQRNSNPPTPNPNNCSNNSPRKTRPIPFTTITSLTQDNLNGNGGVIHSNNSSMYDLNGYEHYDTNNQSPPRSASFYIQTIEGIQSLYSRTGSERIGVEQFVRDRYDGSATFENPLVKIQGSSAIVDIFSLTDLVPGSLYSELGDVFENIQYDGGRTINLTQTLHLTLFPSLRPDQIPIHSVLHSSHPNYSSAPPTPFSQSAEDKSSFSFHPLTSLTSIYTVSIPNHDHHKSNWPILSFFQSLKPSIILSSLTTFHLKIHTKLVLNDQGMIVSHEDIYGIKETIEALPLLSYMYQVNRSAIGLLGTIIRKSLLPKSTFSSNSTVDERKAADEAERRLRESRLDEIRRGTNSSATNLFQFGFGDPLSPMQSRKNSIGSLSINPMASTSSLISGNNYNNNTLNGNGTKKPLLPALEIESLLMKSKNSSRAVESDISVTTIDSGELDRDI